MISLIRTHEIKECSNESSDTYVYYYYDKRSSSGILTIAQYNTEYLDIYSYETDTYNIIYPMKYLETLFNELLPKIESDFNGGLNINMIDLKLRNGKYWTNIATRRTHHEADSVIKFGFE